MVGEGREGTDVGEERRDGSAVVESGGQMNARVIFDERSICGHTHTHAGAAVCADTLSTCVCATDWRSFEGYLEVSHQLPWCCSSPSCVFHLDTQTHNSVYQYFEVSCHT